MQTHAHFVFLFFHDLIYFPFAISNTYSGFQALTVWPPSFLSSEFDCELFCLLLSLMYVTLMCCVVESVCLCVCLRLTVPFRPEWLASLMTICLTEYVYIFWNHFSPHDRCACICESNCLFGHLPRMRSLLFLEKQYASLTVVRSAASVNTFSHIPALMCRFYCD